MGLVTQKCPNCGALIQMEDNRESCFCNYCGAKIMRDKTYVEVSGKVSIDEDQIENKRAKIIADIKNVLPALSTIANLEAEKSKCQSKMNSIEKNIKQDGFVAVTRVWKKVCNY